jgi:ABC-2 type transport system permease protein
MNKWVTNAYAFAIADFKAFFRDKQAMFWTFFFPIMFMLLLGVVFGNAQVIDLKVGVIDQDGTQASAAFAAQIDGLEQVKVVWFNASTFEEANGSARAALDNGDIAVYLIIPRAYGEALASHSSNSSNTTNSSAPVPITVFYANDNTGQGRVALTILSQVIGQVNFAVLNEQPVLFPNPQEIQVSRGRYIDYLVPGIIAMQVMFSGVFNISVVMTSMRQKGILRRLKVTPVPKSAILAALITTRMVVIFVSTAMILAIGILVFGVQLQGSLPFLVLIVIVGSLTFTTFGFAVSAYAKTTESAEAIANTVAMPMMFLGDVFLPVTNMPALIQPIASALPLSFLGKALREVALQGGGPADVVVPMVAVIVYGLIGFFIAIRLFRWE